MIFENYLEAFKDFRPRAGELKNNNCLLDSSFKVHRYGLFKFGKEMMDCDDMTLV